MGAGACIQARAGAVASIGEVRNISGIGGEVIAGIGKQNKGFIERIDQRGGVGLTHLAHQRRGSTGYAGAVFE